MLLSASFQLAPFIPVVDSARHPPHSVAMFRFISKHHVEKYEAGAIFPFLSCRGRVLVPRAPLPPRHDVPVELLPRQHSEAMQLKVISLSWLRKI